jgi:hypothetical protein
MISGRQSRRTVVGITAKLLVPLVVGLIVLTALNSGGLDSWRSLEVAALVGFALLLVLLTAEIAEGFGKLEDSVELVGQIRDSALDSALLTDFVATAGALDAEVTPLLQRVAGREIGRLTRFVRQVAVGNEIAYDGEDREWLLGLTEEADATVDATSLSTVDAGMRGFDGGLWTSDLGTRYLELQREAIRRGVRIRRIFVFENEELARDETFLKITQMQRDVGVEVRMLDHQLIPEWLRSMIFDFIVFDGVVSYETTPATSFSTVGTRPAIVRTLLAPMPARIRDLEELFDQLWTAADPEREVRD